MGVQGVHSFLLPLPIVLNDDGIAVITHPVAVADEFACPNDTAASRRQNLGAIGVGKIQPVVNAVSADFGQQHIVAIRVPLKGIVARPRGERPCQPVMIIGVDGQRDGQWRRPKFGCADQNGHKGGVEIKWLGGVGEEGDVVRPHGRAHGQRRWRKRGCRTRGEGGGGGEQRGNAGAGVRRGGGHERRGRGQNQRSQSARRGAASH